MPAAERPSGKRELLVSKTWLQVAGLVVVVGFFVLVLLAYRTYQSDPPIPDRVLDPSGRVVFTGDDIRAGQTVFLHHGLMEYGSIFGHGAYLGPDFTDDYLHRASASVRNQLGGDASDSARQQTIDQFQTNRYDSDTKTLPYSAQQATAFTQLEQHYHDFFSTDTTRYGLRPDSVKDPQEIHQLTSFFAWSAWAAATRRPGHNYSYTNNWPPEEQVGNTPSANVIVWSVLSLIALLGGIGILFAAFGRWRMGWQGRDQATLTFRLPGDVALTPGQRATAWFFFVMSLLFLLQTLVGGMSQHYRADLGGFFGIDVAQVFPYNLVRTWHVQLAIFFVATSFVAAGIFLAPMIAGREPKHQNKLAFFLLGALAVVVFGSLFGEFADIHNWFSGSIFGDQGFEYLDLGRFWQVLLIIGLCVWGFILYRGLKGRLTKERVGNMPWLFFLAALAIPAFYAVGLLVRSGDNFTITDYWRFWVVHLWVEDFLELFTTAMVAYIFVLLGVVRERVALTVVLLDIILYSVGGVIGTMHHLYFSGAPAENMALGAFFSALEVMPLTFLTVEAWSFLQLGARQESKSRTPFPHRWAVMFLVAVGFWNFLGAGIFGFLINLPIVSYYEIARPDLVDFLWTIPFAAVIAVVTFLIFRLAREAQRIAAPRPFILLPAAGLLVAGLAIAFTESTDHGANQVLFSGQSAIGPLVADPGTWSLSALALLIAFKGLAYGVSLGTFRGGPTFPAMFLGAAGGLMAAKLPGFELTPAVAVGLGTAVVAVLRLPLSAVVLATLFTVHTGLGSGPLIIVGVVVAYLTVQALDGRASSGQSGAGGTDDAGRPDPAAMPSVLTVTQAVRTLMTHRCRRCRAEQLIT